MYLFYYVDGEVILDEGSKDYMLFLVDLNITNEE